MTPEKYYWPRQRQMEQRLCTYEEQFYGYKVY